MSEGKDEIDVSNLIGDYHQFLDRIFAALEKVKIDVSHYKLDHICFRVENNDEYYEKKNELLSFASLLYETLVNGRPIATYRLNTPIQYKERKISLLELPSVKESSPYKRGLEHVEFVIDKDFNSFIQLYPHVNFDVKAISKENNPDISIQFEDGIAVKFHHSPLDVVIENEIKVDQSSA